MHLNSCCPSGGQVGQALMSLLAVSLYALACSSVSEAAATSRRSLSQQQPGSPAAAAPPSSSSVVVRPQRQLVVFGDSLSDDGNLFAQTHRLIPTPASYWRGRFSNGPIWVDSVAAADPRVTPLVYAFGGATACPTKDNIPDLVGQIKSYLAGDSPADAAGGSRAAAEQLVVVWIGHNDVLLRPDVAEGASIPADVGRALVANVTACVSEGLAALLQGLQAPGQEQHGTSNTGRRRRLQQEPAPAPVAPPRVVVWTLAPVDIAPGVPASAKASVKQTVASINAAIGRMVTGLLVQAPGVRLDLFDAHAAVSSAFKVATTQLGFKNKSAPCLAPRDDAAPLSAGASAIVEATAGSEGRCADPDAYTWYDGVHPTSRAHRIVLAEPFLEFLGQDASAAGPGGAVTGKIAPGSSVGDGNVRK